MDQLFKVFLLEETEARKIAASPDEPHQHDFEEVLIGIEGALEHFIDYKSVQIQAPYASFVTKGKVHRLIPRIKNGRCKVWAVRFNSEFIPDTTFRLYSYYHGHANIPLKKGWRFDRLVTLCEMMHGEMQQDNPDYSVVRHLLSALFTMIESERRKSSQNDALLSTQNVTFRNFLQILEENFQRPEGVDFYADKLFMSSRNLNLICRNILHQSVSEIIETRKLIEAKNLLIGTDKSISEIGFELGYNEKSYFTNVFKKKSGQTPSEFREEMRALIS